jgi:hypothetical protein
MLVTKGNNIRAERDGLAQRGLLRVEKDVAEVIGLWRGFPQTLICILLPLAALVVLKSKEYAAQAAAAHDALNAIPDAYIRRQMTGAVCAPDGRAG